MAFSRREYERYAVPGLTHISVAEWHQGKKWDQNCPGDPLGFGNTYTRNSANSNYNSFQASVERKAADMTFLAAYTFGKVLDDASTFGDLMNFTNYRLSCSLSSFDVTHNFVASYNWALPFDRTFGNLPKGLTEVGTSAELPAAHRAGERKVLWVMAGSSKSLTYSSWCSKKGNWM